MWKLLKSCGRLAVLVRPAPDRHHGVLEPEELRRRLDAIRTLRGLRQVDLAALVETDGHGKHDVGRLERGDVHLSPSLRRSLAHHLQVPEDWFTEPDLDRVIASRGAADPDQLDRIEAWLEQNQQLLLLIAAERGLIEPTGADRAFRDVRAWLAKREGQDPPSAQPGAG
jgi:transcriptional regulator with XRE-family HTH domain